MKLSRQFWENQLGEEWTRILQHTLRSEYMEKLMNFLKMEYSLNEIRPSEKSDVFKAFKLCPFENLKVVIIGSDPSCIIQSSGLLMGTKSTQNYLPFQLFAIRKYVEESCGLNIDFDCSLESWCSQGVLLLNTAQTARADRPMSHIRPWNKFITSVIRNINDVSPGTIFLFLGKEGMEFLPLISSNHDILFMNTSNNAEEFNNDIHDYSFKKINLLLESKYGKSGIINW
jgi:uracil-DNA glycosylase